MNTETECRIKLAKYDYDTAQAMLDTMRFLYVAFMCHQVIEKMLKAYWSKVMEEPPIKIHALARLAQKTGLEEAMSEQQLSFIDELEPMNIATRYPDYRDSLPRSLTAEKCKEIMVKTKELKEWIKSKL